MTTISEPRAPVDVAVRPAITVDRPAATGIMVAWVLALRVLAWTTLRQRDVV